jgi:hypothetical protein
VLVVALWLSAVAGCESDARPVAVLKQAAADTQKQIGSRDWEPATVGASFYLGDAVRSGEAAALLEVGGGNLQLAPRTRIRFGNKVRKNGGIELELGAATLEGGKEYQLAFGKVIMSEAGGRLLLDSSGITVLLGSATLERSDGTIEALAQGQTYLTLGNAVVDPVVDAGAAPMDAAVDAAEPAADVLALAVKGKKGQQRADGATAWAPLPAGAHEIVGGNLVKLGDATTAKGTLGKTSFDLGAGTTVAIGGDPFIQFQSGKVTAQSSEETRLGLPGGFLLLRGGDRPASASAEIKGNEVRITILRGPAELVGSAGSKTQLQTGETASMTKGGTVDVIAKVPDYFDLRIPLGASATLHDPKPPTAVRITFGDRCKDGGDLEVGRDKNMTGARRSAGSEGANVLLPAGSWYYRVRCEGGGGDDGRILIRRDDGRKVLPRKAPDFDAEADGRNWTVSYQNQPPNVVFSWPRPPASAGYKLNLKFRDNTQVFDGKNAVVKVPGDKLEEGTHVFWFETSSGKKSRQSLLTLDFDNAAPFAYVESPVNARPWSEQIVVKGSAMEGSKVSIDGIDVPLDRQRRFSITVSAPSSNALPIQLVHPQGGTHYYLRRQR